jgi:hypothetical protein
MTRVVMVAHDLDPPVSSLQRLLGAGLLWTGRALHPFRAWSEKSAQRVRTSLRMDTWTAKARKRVVRPGESRQQAIESAYRHRRGADACNFAP